MRVIRFKTDESLGRVGLGLLVALSLTGVRAEAFPRGHREDADVAARSILIVARMEEGRSGGRTSEPSTAGG